MENLLDELNNIFEETEKQITILEDWSMEIIQSQEQGEKRFKKISSETCEKNVKHTNMDAIWLPDR